MSGPTWQSEAQRPHKAIYDDVARRMREAMGAALAARSATRSVEAAQASPTTATGLTKEAAIEALQKANAEVAAAEERCRETELAIKGAERQHGAAMTALASFADVEQRVQNARVGAARTSPNGEFVLPPALAEARSKRATAAQSAQDTEMTVAGLRAELTADEERLRKALSARLRAKGLRLAVDAAADDRRLIGLLEEMADIREHQRARRDIASFDGPIPQALSDATSRGARLELTSDHVTTPEQYRVIQGNYRRRQNQHWRALDSDPAAELE